MPNPQIVVLSSDANSVIGSIAGTGATKSSSFKPIAEKIEQYKKDGTVGKQPTALVWYKNTKGTYQKLSFHDIDESSIYLGNGNRKLKHSTFQPGAIKFAKRYKKHHQELKIAAAVKGLKDSFVYPETEKWTSSQGKTVKAQFKSLSEDNQLTLVVKRIGHQDKLYKLPLDKFDQASQDKAKKWQETLTSQNEKLEKAKQEALK